MEKTKPTTIEKMFPRSSLQAIAEKIGRLIKHDVAIYSSGGVLIAATNKSRIGLHSPHIESLINSDEEIFVVSEYSDDVKLNIGVNQPLTYEDVRIGALGITGEVGEVSIFCRMVQEFLQQQLHDLQRERHNADHYRVVNNYVYSLIYKEARPTQPEFFSRSKALNVDPEKSHLCCILQTSNVDQQSHVFNYLYDKLQSISKSFLTSQLGTDIVLIFEATDEMNSKRIMSDARAAIMRHFNCECYIGIGGSVENIDDIHLSYTAAKLACETSCKTEAHDIVFYELYNIEILLSTADDQLKQKIYNYTFRNYESTAEINEAVLMITSYVEYNRSISEVASVLNLHKNTVQFRLNKIHSQTGYDPHVTKDLSLLYTIAIIHNTGTRKTD